MSGSYDRETAEPAPSESGAPGRAEARATPVSTVADGIEHRLDSRSVTADRIAGCVFGGILVSGTLFVLLAVLLFGSVPPHVAVLLVGGWVVAAGALALLVLWWPAVRFRYTAYLVIEEGIVIRRGVLWRSVHSVPRSRVQHTDVTQGPIERAFELATLTVFTAGTQHASIALSGLQRDRAFRIRDHLIAGGGAADAV